MGRRINSTFRTELLLLSIFYGLVTCQTDTELYDDTDSILFPGPIGKQQGSTDSDSNISKSIKLAQEINSLNSLEDFLKMVHGVPPNEIKYSISSRIGGESERSNAVAATPAKCMPELQPVPLKQDNDTGTVFYPSCTRIRRCGGCCGHALLSCQPTAVEVRNFEVIVASIGMNYRGKRIVPLEEHTKCKCDCRIKPEHCTEKQIYVKEECRCVCSNVDEEEKCRKNNETKLWDPNLCLCLCRTVQECNTGYYFDQNSCRCRQVPISRGWFLPTRGTGYRLGQTQKPETVPPVIVSLDASDPRRKPKDDPEYK